MKLKSFLAIIGSLLFFSFSSFAQQTIIVPDLEGNLFKITTLIERGVLQDINGHLQQTNSLDQIWFLGDIVRRGPHGSELLTEILSLKAQNRNTVLLAGNHDFNTLSFLTLLPSLELGLIQDYNQWLGGMENTKFAKLMWWANKYSLKDKVLNFWVELVAHKLNISPSDPVFKNQFYANRDSLEERLKAVVSENELAT